MQSAGSVSLDTASEPGLNHVELTLCDACLDGVGGECHVPGCAFWMSTAPDIPIREKVDHELAEALDAAIEEGHCWEGHAWSEGFVAHCESCELVRPVAARSLGRGDLAQVTYTPEEHAEHFGYKAPEAGPNG